MCYHFCSVFDPLVDWADFDKMAVIAVLSNATMLADGIWCRSSFQTEPLFMK